MCFIEPAAGSHGMSELQTWPTVASSWVEGLDGHRILGACSVLPRFDWATRFLRVTSLPQLASHAFLEVAQIADVAFLLEFLRLGLHPIATMPTED